MDPASATSAPHAHTLGGEHRQRLFVLSIVALATAGISASLRATINPVLQHGYLDKIDATKSGQMVGEILGISFLGFAFTIAIGSALLDLLGMRTLLLLSSACFVLGTSLVAGIDRIQGALGTYTALWIGMLLTGVAWGLVECVINPLVASIYIENKTGKLNTLHAWWPAGLIIGSFIGMTVHVDPQTYSGVWRLPYLVAIVPALAFGVLVALTEFPVTERVAHGVPTGTMFRQALKPFFLVWFLCMTMTAACELAPGQWVNLALTDTVHMPGILVLVYISALMYVMRHFAGHPAKLLTPVGLLWCSALLAGIGLFALSKASSPLGAVAAATFWGVGVCYMWPTMLAAASERFPRGGALLMGLMGTAGTLSIWYFLPKMGAIADRVKLALASGQDPGSAPLLLLSSIGQGLRGVAETLHLMPPPTPATGADAAYVALQAAAKTDAAALSKLTAINAQANATSFEAMAFVTVVLLVVFGLIWMADRMRGGYKAERLTQAA